MTEKEIREAQKLGLIYEEQVPMKWTWPGRRRLETPERPAPLPEGYIDNGFWGPTAESALAL